MNIHEYQAKQLLGEFGVTVPRGKPAFNVDEAVAAARDNENVEKFLAEKTIRKIIYVPNKILNFVVS